MRKADDDALMNAETVTLCQRLPRGEMDERPCRKTSDARGFGPGREARGLNEIKEAKFTPGRNHSTNICTYIYLFIHYIDLKCDYIVFNIIFSDMLHAVELSFK